MWPMLLDLTLGECRRTLRSLELEAYANIMSVFRAQGPLEENRKKILEELRGVLHITNDRHSAEARRVSNDELLATIADRLYGPYTNLGWICEGRRRVPLLPRAVPQSMYTELADRAAAACRAENLERAKRASEPRDHRDDKHAADNAKADRLASDNSDHLYPVAMEDPTIKLWDTELISRKRKVSEPTGEDASTPVKNLRNISVNPNQKHVNLSQLYSKFSHQATSKPSQSKHSYNQVSKVSTSKSNHPTARVHKQRSHKIAKSAAQHMSSKQRKQPPASPPPPAHTAHPPPPAAVSAAPGDYSGPPNTFQASYAASVLGKHEATLPAATPPSVALAPIPAPAPHAASHAAPHAAPPPHAVSGKPCQLVIKKRGEVAVEAAGSRAPHKPIESIKLLSSRPLVVSPRPLPPGKFLATKVIGSLPRARAAPPPPAPHALPADKMIVVSKAAAGGEARAPAQKLVVTSSGGHASAPRFSDALTPKGIPATDLKVSAKTFVLNPKSGQKMVVVPAKSRSKPGGEGPGPVLHFKGGATPMKLVSMGAPQAAKPPLVPQPRAPPADTIRTANMADIVPVKGLAAGARLPSKAGVIVVQKGAPLGKALTFTKNGSDVSKIIMGKNVNQLLQASKAEPPDAPNVIVLELNNEQSARATTVSEILGRSAAATAAVPTAPVTTTGPPTAAPAGERPDGATDWELELDAAGAGVGSAAAAGVGAGVSAGEDKLNSLHLDLGMSSDSDADYLPPPASPPPAPPAPPPAVSAAPAPPATTTPADHTGPTVPITLANRTLLSQLQDEGSSSNDSSFALKPKHNRSEAESDALAQAKEKLTEKVAADKARHRRIDVFSTAIAPTDINLDSFSYLEDDDEFDGKRPDALHDQLSRLLDDTPVTQLNKQ